MSRSKDLALVATRRAALTSVVVALALCAACKGCRTSDPWKDLDVRSPKKPGDGQLSLVLVGDILLDRKVKASVAKNGGGDWAFPFQKVAPYLQEADVAFGNLECPVSGKGEKLDKKYVFNAPADAVKGLVAAGFDVLSLANNHTFDYGPVAAEDTTRILTEAGIRSGGIVAKDQPQTPVVVDVRGTKVGFLFYCDPKTKYSCAREFFQFEVRPAEATRENLARDVALLRPNVDVVVVSLHWGVEHREEPSKHMVDLGRWLVDQGVDVVAGHHPHMQQKVERWKKGVILYSMGNFIFDQITRPGARVSRVYRLVLGENGVEEVLFLPLELSKETWQAIPLTEGYVDVAQDTLHLRTKLPGE